MCQLSVRLLREVKNRLGPLTRRENEFNVMCQLSIRKLS